MNLTRLLTLRLTRFWLWSLSATALVWLLFALLGYVHLAGRLQQHQVDIIQQQLQQHYQAGQLLELDIWLPPLLQAADATEFSLWRGSQRLYHYPPKPAITEPILIRFQVTGEPPLQAELKLPQPLLQYRPSDTEWAVMLLGLLVILALMQLGYRWYAEQLRGMEAVAARSRLVLKGQYEQARILDSQQHPRFINRAISRLLDELSDARKERARFDNFIRSNTFLDAETRIGNRLFLDNRLDALSNEQGMMAHGAILLLEFAELEQLHGDGEVSDYLNLNVAHIGRLLHSQANSIFARRSYNQLAIVVTQISLAEAEQLALRLMKLCHSLLPRELDNRSNSFHLGVAYFKLGDNPQQLLEEAEMALRAAQIQANNTWFMYDKGAVDEEFARGSVRWRTFLELALQQRRFLAYVQPVQDADGRLHHQEVFTRAREVNGTLVRATLFLPMALKCGLIPQIERQTIERVVLELLPKATDSSSRFSINLSQDTLQNADFMRWLRTLLLEHRDLAPRLIFEVDEAFASVHLVDLYPKLQLIKKMGAKLCVDHVGQQVVSTQYIVEGGFELVKLHRSLVKQIHLRPENQLFIRSLMGGLQQTEVEVIAEGVELFEEWQILRVLGISAAQGPWFGDPEIR